MSNLQIVVEKKYKVISVDLYGVEDVLGIFYTREDADLFLRSVQYQDRAIDIEESYDEV
jgi:hypothetical protein